MDENYDAESIAQQNPRMYSHDYMEYKAEIRFVQEVIRSHTNHNVPKEMSAYILNTVRVYNKIPAIKEIRACTGLMLKPAKNIFDLIELREYCKE